MTGLIALGVGVTVATGTGTGVNIGLATSKAVDVTARQPEANGKITKTPLLGCVLAEAIAIYGFVIGLLTILFLKQFMAGRRLNMLSSNIWNVAFTVINLLVLYLLMKRFLIDPVRRILDERKQMIERDLGETKNREIETYQMKEQYQAPVGNADEGASEIIKETRNRTATEYEKVLVQAEADATGRLEGADRIIALERKKAMNGLKTGVAGLAITTAVKLISEQNTPDGDRNLYDRFLAGSDEGNN